MPSNLPQYGIRAKRELMDKLKYIAEVHGRSVNKEIVQLIKEHVDRYEQQHGAIPPRDDQE